MKFRPCIDIHNGKVKQIVGGSLKDAGDQAEENFVSEQDAAFFARLYQNKKLSGGHIILLNPPSSEFYEQTKRQALSALRAYPGGLQIGGGITPENAGEYLEAGASHVIVTSYVFKDGKLHYDRLQEMVRAVSKNRLVMDLSCRKRDGSYYIVTDRWQKYTDVLLNEETLHKLAGFCDEFLVHAVDVEGKANGIEAEVAALLGNSCEIPSTYAGGVHSYEDLEKLKLLGRNRVDVTIGSALDLFGGRMSFETVVLLSQQKPDDTIEIDLDLDELDATSAELKATYQEIKDYVLKEFGLKVSSLYISQVKRKCGIEVGENYNLPKSENARVPQCPKEKEDAIKAALKYFAMI
jgi:phosphoribosylformimino-5-aminoimidazole carboxamide ribotide isomerase